MTSGEYIGLLRAEIFYINLHLTGAKSRNPFSLAKVCQQTGYPNGYAFEGQVRNLTSAHFSSISFKIHSRLRFTNAPLQFTSSPSVTPKKRRSRRSTVVYLVFSFAPVFLIQFSRCSSGLSFWGWLSDVWSRSQCTRRSQCA